MMAAVAGQKINMTALNGTPGTTWSVVRVPATKTGTERASSRTTNLRGDLLRDANVFKKSSSNDYGYWFQAHCDSLTHANIRLKP
jgi:hypothetical protein